MATRTPAAWETRRPLLPELALIIATIGFGATFKLVQNALVDVTPVGYMLLRFGVAGDRARCRSRSATGGATAKPGAEPTADNLGSFVKVGIVFGAIGWVGYWFQNVGLQHTTTSESAFITGLFVVFTPIVETIVIRRFPNRSVIVAVSMAAVGLFLLTGAQFGLSFGNALDAVLRRCRSACGSTSAAGSRIASTRSRSCSSRWSSSPCCRCRWS